MASAESAGASQTPLATTATGLELGVGVGDGLGEGIGDGEGLAAADVVAPDEVVGLGDGDVVVVGAQAVVANTNTHSTRHRSGCSRGTGSGW
ncbi:MAG: hypothetical protein ACRDF7_06255 [Candidatus Limnocylindrales bacterium]